MYLGAEWFVAGASALALALRIPQVLIGLTVVAYGTSAPEIIVGIAAARSGHGATALGNVVGSNLANLGLILGITALICPARVDGAFRRRELPMLALSTLLVPVVLWDGRISQAEAWILLGLALLYTSWMVYSVRSAVGSSELSDETLSEETYTVMEAARTASAFRVIGVGRSAFLALIGLTVLLLSGQIFVAGAVQLAVWLGLSDHVIGLTLVALGTSLPELVTSVIAARRGHAELAVGNVIGSNIFNVLLCLGTAALVGRVAAPFASLYLEVGTLLLLSGLTVFLIRHERTISRQEGAVLCGIYVLFLVLTLMP